MHCWLALLIFVIFHFCTSQAQDSCLDPCTLPLEYCKSIDYPVYPVGLDVASNERNVSLLYTDERISYLPQACQNALKKFACTIYSSCRNDSNGRLVEIRPCINMCYNVYDACGDFVALFPATQKALLNCTGVKSDGTPVFSTDTEQCVSITSLSPHCDNSTDNSTTPPSKNTNPNGGCQIYDPSLNTKTSSLCSPYVSNEIFVLNPSNPRIQIGLDEFIGEKAQFLMKYYPLMPIKCFKMLSSLMCRAAYPSCIRVNETWEDSERHCNAFCQDTLEACSQLLSLVDDTNTTMVSCSDNLPGSSKPAFPMEGNCNNNILPRNAYTTFSLPVIESCPSLLGKKEHPTDDETPCAYPCPDLSYSKPQQDALIYGALICGSISFVLMVVYGSSVVLVAEKRVFPANLNIWMAFSEACLSVCFFLGGSEPQKTVWCKDAGTFSTQSSNPRCGAQAFIFSYFSLTALSCCSVLGFTLFAVIVLGKKHHIIGQYMKYFHIFIWGFPLIFCVTALALGAYGYMSILPFCFFSVIDMSRVYVAPVDSFTLDWALIPMGVLSIFCIITFVATEAKILLVQKQVFKGTTFAALRRVGYLILLLSAVILIVLEWRVELEVDGLDKMQSRVKDWFMCKVKTDLNIPNPGYCPQKLAPMGFQYPHLIIICLLAASLGILEFCIFGFDKENYKMWPLVYETVLRTHDYAGLWKVIQFGTKRHEWLSYRPKYSKDSKTSKTASVETQPHEETETETEKQTQQNKEKNKTEISLENMSIEMTSVAPTSPHTSSASGVDLDDTDENFSETSPSSV